MLRTERDYLLRMIAIAAAAVARLRERLRGGALPNEVIQAARTAQGELLGKDAALLRALDPASAMHALGDKDRLAAWAELLRVEAEAARAAGHLAEADALDRRADALSKK